MAMQKGVRRANVSWVLVRMISPGSHDNAGKPCIAKFNVPFPVLSHTVKATQHGLRTTMSRFLQVLLVSKDLASSYTVI